jgi:hypothetical protein
MCDDSVALWQDQMRVSASGTSKATDLNNVKKREERINRILESMEAEREAGYLSSEKPGIAEFSVVSALGYFNFRHGSSWRETFPGLAIFHDEMQAHDFIRATNPRE